MTKIRKPYKYFMVHGRGPAKYKHTTFKEAWEEADRLSKENPGINFTVLKGVAFACRDKEGRGNPQPPPYFRQFLDEDKPEAKTSAKYKFRGMSSIYSAWNVSGTMTDDDGNVSGGVLEWCSSREDAYAVFNYMSTFECFSNLRVCGEEE